MAKSLMKQAVSAAYQHIPSSVCGCLEINLGAVATNYHLIQKKIAPAISGAVVKANAYGFGAQEISRRLFQEGCQHFFVAHVEEGIALRNVLPKAEIYVFSGVLPGTAEVFIKKKLTPVINDFPMLEAWLQKADSLDKKMPLVLHLDTGMSRIGMDYRDIKRLEEQYNILTKADIHFVMSHLACSEDLKHALNAQQLAQFKTYLEMFPGKKASLANSEGIFLGPDYYFDIVRPGKGLFGLHQSPDPNLRFVECMKIMGRVVQIRSALKGETVGYGATCQLERDSRLAVIGIGFADGYPRGLGNKGHVSIAGFKATVMGRISMDYMVVDVTDIPESFLSVGMWADIFHETMSLDQAASAIGTISRELSTRFGDRLFRVYTEEKV